MLRCVALFFPLLLLAWPAAGRAEGVLGRVDARHEDVVRPSLESVFGASDPAALEAAVAAERARLETAAGERPGERVEATLVLARPLGRDEILALQNALGGEVLALRARTRSGKGVDVQDYDLSSMQGDLAAKLEALRPRSSSSVRVGTGRDSADRPTRLGREESLIDSPRPRPERRPPLRFVEVRLSADPARLLEQVPRESGVLALRLD
jgi:hypothetical protein